MADQWLDVEIWFDIACPWCLLGRQRWHRALGSFDHAERVRTTWRSFELRPGYPLGPGRRLVDIMREDWEMGAAEVDEVLGRIRAEGAAAGLAMRPERVRPTNTFDAHQVLHLAVDRGRGEEMLERLYDAYHVATVDLSDREVLVRLAVEAGLPEALAWDTLRTGRYAEAVREDERLAIRRGVTAVPSYRIQTGTAVSGALPVETLLQLLEQGWERATAGSAPGRP